MQVNYDIWGEPSTWETPSNQQIDLSGLEGKLPVFDPTFSDVTEGRFSVKSAVRLGEIDNQFPLDNSPCPWRIRGNCYWTDLYKVTMIGQDYLNFDYKYDSPVYSEETRNIGAPVALTYGSSPSMSSTSSEYVPGMLHPDYIWGRVPGDTKYGADFAPLLDFNYRKICVVPYIQCFYNGYQVVSYNTYVNNGGHTRYRYLQGLQPRIYIGGAGHWTPAPMGLRLRLFGARIDPFIVKWPRVNVGTDIEEFYANEDGLLSYGDGIGSYLLGATRFTDGFTIHSRSLISPSEDICYGLQMDQAYLNNNYRVFYRPLPEGWFITKRPDTGREYISEYDNVNGEYTPDWILEQFACLGLWIYTGADVANFDPEHPDEYSHAPVFDKYGTTTGETVSGAAAAQTPAGTWTTNVQGKDVYKGEEPPFDPTDYDPYNKTEWGSPILNINTNVYALGETFSDAMAYFYTDVKSNGDLEYCLKNYLSTSPIDCVQALIVYPIQIVPEVVPTPTTQHIWFGNVESDVNGYVMPYKSSMYDMGSINVVRHFNDFRDFEPYTSLELVLPYCGLVKLDPSVYMGKRLKMKYIIDWTTGACTAALLADNLMIQTVNGQIGISIPLTGMQQSQIAQAVSNAQLQYRQQMQTAVSSMITTTAATAAGSLSGGGGSVAGLVSAAVGGLGAISRASDRYDYAIEHVQAPLKTVGGSSSGVSMLMEQRPRLIITRPKMLPGYEPEIFSKVQGNACCVTAALRDLPGYVQVSNADLSGINASESEKAAILSLLKSGVYI